MSTARSVLSRPRWLILAGLMAVLVPVAAALGLWQLDRLEERRLSNAVSQQRLSLEPVPWDVIAADEETMAGGELRFVRVTVEGEFLATEQVLVRNRSQGGVTGHWVVTPIVTEDDGALAVLRGWVPFDWDDPFDPRLVPPPGKVRFEGVLIPGEHPTALGPSNPDGRLTRMALLDLERLAGQTGLDLGDHYLQLTSPADEGFPQNVELPDSTDTGPHLAYAIQWFSFAAIGLFGFIALLRREMRARGTRVPRAPSAP